jgi:uncharacterized repeat protein (TIGR03803 family)
MSKFNCVAKSCGVFLLWAAAAAALSAQTFTTLLNFGGPDGEAPFAGLIQGSDGNFLGTTLYGGASDACHLGCGTIFAITPGGTLTTLHSFISTDGDLPYGVLAQGTNGQFYGTTYSGGAEGDGTVFSVTASGALKTLHNFVGMDGASPYAGLVQGTNGDFYGTALEGGANSNASCADFSCGTVFKITPGGTLTTLYNFCTLSNCTDGDNPYAGLVQATNGQFYGTTLGGGAHGDGTVFSITASGTLKTLHNFAGGSTDGAYPYAALVQGTNGDLYGTTYLGGANVCGGLGCGTVFSITPNGKLTTLYNFCSQSGCTDGELPYAGLIQGTDGNFYGTTAYGGAGGLAGYGTVFQITPSGTLTTLHTFMVTDGANPDGGLIQATNGTFYGITPAGGASEDCMINGVQGCGTVFSLSLGLGQFVETLPISGKVGAAVRILGSFLTGSTSVTFNGTPATFSINSKSEITTTVPTGATTGTVQVVTPRLGTLSSNVPFTVRS